MNDHNSVDQSWRTPILRQKIVAQIDDAIRQCNSPIGRNSEEMESHVYNKAKTKDEYMSFVARLILHIREMNSSNKQISTFMPNTSGMLPASNQDPIIALQSLAHQEVPLSYFPGGTGQLTGPTNQQAATMGSLLATQNPQLGAALSSHSLVNAGVTTSDSLGMPMHGQLQNNIPCIGNNQQRAQIPQNVAQMHSGPMGTLSKNATKQQALMAQQQKLMQHNIRQVAHSPQPSIANMPPPSKPATPLRSLSPGLGDGNQMMMIRDPNQSGTAGQFFPQTMSSLPRQGTPVQFIGHNSGTVQAPIQGGMVPSPAQQIPPNMTSSQMAPSPVNYLHSQSPQIVPSPVGSVPMPSVRTPGNMGAPSPTGALNTPAMVGMVASPVNRNQEDQIYLEKVKHLSKYIEPLRRMIVRIDKDEDKKKELSKMKSLLDILSNPAKRLQMDTLLKCEQVLEKLELKSDAGVTNLSSGSNMAQVPPLLHQLQYNHQQPNHLPGSKEYNVCQPLLDAIVGHLGSPTFTHTLQRTFAPAVAILHGTSFSGNNSPQPKKKFKMEFANADISDALQGEIARLDRRFKINLDPIQNSKSKTVHLVCQLDDRNLPCVPPIMLMVPTSYPQKAPQCELSSEEYESTEFLQKIHQTLIEKLTKMPDQFSITSVLDTWEMSVRQACSLSTGEVN